MSPDKPSSDVEADAVLRDLCKSIDSSCFVDETDEGLMRVELPLRYPNGENIILVIRRDGTISDAGATLLALMRENQLEAVNEWPEFPALLRTHYTQRNGAELLLPPEFRNYMIKYLEGLRMLLQVAPRSSARSQAFDDQVRRSVRKVLADHVEAGRLTEDELDLITHPSLEARVRRESTANPVTVPVTVDFQNLARDQFYVILSHGGSTHGERLAHISAKLVNHVLLRTEVQPNPVETFALVPFDGGYSSEELDRIALYTGQDPIVFDPDKQTKRFVRRLVEVPEGPF